MILERGLWAFFQGVRRLVRATFVEASPGQELVTAASSHIFERVAVLANLRERLAKIIGQVHIEVDKMGEKVSNGRKVRVASSEYTVAVLKTLSVLDGEYQLPQKDYHSQGDLSMVVTLVLDFEELPDILARRMEWTDNELDDGLQLLSDNMWKLQNFLGTVMGHHWRPRNVVRNWLYYTGGAIGSRMLSGWLYRHSQLSGSDDLNRWTKEGIDATGGFFEEHVQQLVFVKRIVRSCSDLPLDCTFFCLQSHSLLSPVFVQFENCPYWFTVRYMASYVVLVHCVIYEIIAIHLKTASQFQALPHNIATLA